MNGTRDAAAVVAVLALVGVVAVSANGRPVSSLVQQGAADRIRILTDIGILLAIGGAVAMAITLLVHGAVRRRAGDVPFRATLLRATPIAAACLVVFSLLVMGSTDLGGREAGAPEEAYGAVMPGSGRPGRPLEVVGWWASKVRAGEGAPDREVPTDARPPDPGLPPLALWAALAALILAGAAAWRRLRGPGAAPVAEGEDDGTEARRAAAHDAVVGTIDAMLADPDPRTAIIGAYARLLEHLAASGAARREPEAPLEHLRRVLTTLRVRPEPLRELIELFALARFSTHALDASHRRRALGALGAVADDLAPLGARPVGAGTGSPRP